MADSLNPIVIKTREYEERIPKKPTEPDRPAPTQPPSAPSNTLPVMGADAERQLAQLMKGFQF